VADIVYRSSRHTYTRITVIVAKSPPDVEMLSYRSILHSFFRYALTHLSYIPPLHADSAALQSHCLAVLNSFWPLPLFEELGLQQAITPGLPLYKAAAAVSSAPA
jgi:hypothetical protein